MGTAGRSGGTVRTDRTDSAAVAAGTGVVTPHVLRLGWLGTGGGAAGIIGTHVGAGGAMYRVTG